MGHCSGASTPNHSDAPCKDSLAMMVQQVHGQPTTTSNTAVSHAQQAANGAVTNGTRHL